MNKAGDGAYYKPITLDEALYMATAGGAEGQKIALKLTPCTLLITVLSLQDKIGNFKVWAMLMTNFIANFLL